MLMVINITIEFLHDSRCVTCCWEWDNRNNATLIENNRNKIMVTKRTQSCVLNP